MRITVIGWYGTETIGDRGILAGLVSIFNQSFKNFEINLGSLNPFFTKRTLAEDASFFEEITGKPVRIELFNTKSSQDLIEAITNSDLLVMGGGPLMDLSELCMVEYAFKKARKLGVKTAILGCGVGPLFSKNYRQSVLNIFLNSNISILRDSKSKGFLRGIYKEFDQKFEEDNVFVSFDPAVECTLKSNQFVSKLIPVNCSPDYIAVNLREFPIEYSGRLSGHDINRDLVKFVADLADEFPQKIIKLYPMHYFHIGGDDRIFLNNIARQLNRPNIYVQNSPLTLDETIDVFRKAFFNVGMRFHSVVLQTIASGKNYVLDYTEPNKGKINGFLKDVDKINFYKNRYICLQEGNISASIINIDDIDSKFKFDDKHILSSLSIYSDQLKALIK
ncbi:polysaccharide pyruvyl transferase family protein [Psychromonas ossibalaenae]|uniref:polysaccharide pyruvyl transferase family protein n=1 Tax=Psychromonas ossibalaenae TaxID=444922 RepID=UPI00037F640C|nr:polysaccharide pyruvyl transferase family protein [Psychromonas ossibalaenae]